MATLRIEGLSELSAPVERQFERKLWGTDADPLARLARFVWAGGLVGPLVSGWLPLVLFGSLGVVLTASMRS